MIVLGASGSIGTNTLELAERYGLEVEVLGVGRNVYFLNEQILKFNPKSVVVAEPEYIDDVTKDFKGEIYSGPEGILQAIKNAKSTLLINAIVGFAGLAPTLCAINCGKKVALANKESLVVGGNLIESDKIIPIDSEHFSLASLLGFYSPHPKSFKKLYITASGGAFRDLDVSLIPFQNAKRALKHPNWSMGKKITIDSATMVNKLFEILEAYWLFQSKNIDALIERNSHIHALVEFWDGSVLAHFANANMQLPIAYALCFGLGLGEEFLEKFHTSQNSGRRSIIEPLRFTNISYEFQKIDTDRYPLWNLKKALLENPKLGLFLNAADEVAVAAFLKDSIPFGAISTIIQNTIKAFEKEDFTDLESIIFLDKEARAFAKNQLKK